MPGIIGFAGQFGGQAADAQLLAQMAQALEPEPRFRVELAQRAAWGIGRVTLGIANPEAQPLWNASKTIGLVMEGELFDPSAARQSLLAQGYPLQDGGDAALLLGLYETRGEAFVEGLNGAFSVALWDNTAQKLVIANDRLGLHPVYYSRSHDGLIFGSGVRALLAHPALPRCVDHVGVAQFLAFDHLLGQRTLVEDVQLLPQATVLVYEDGYLRQQRNWEPLHPREYPFRLETEWMDDLLHHLRQAMVRQAPSGEVPAGMLLSGGLDSRLLLALLGESQPLDSFHTFSWGLPGCDDARFAAEVADALGSQHHFFALRPDWLRGMAEEAVRITDGMGNLVNLHAGATLKEQTEHAQILYKGFLGDAMAGFAQRPQHWADYSPDNAIRAHQLAHREQGVLIFEQDRLDQTLTAAFRERVGDAVMESYRAGMAAARTAQLADQRIYYDYTQRVPRHTLNGVLMVRSRAEVRLPFVDRDLVSLMLTIPPGFRYRRELMRNTFIRQFPKLAQIPVPDTGLPLIDCARDVRIRAQRLVRWHLNKAGLKRVDYLQRRPYKDYGTWFRTVLRDWVEDNLLSQRSLQRGYFEPEAIRGLVRAHMNGADHSIRLGVLLSLELWQQQYMD
ncbi:MAG: asparagine synthase-related protein [Anaerolineae bacterium]|nr:asparagine synthase-related protein [Anaerolineae bacterium]